MQKLLNLTRLVLGIVFGLACISLAVSQGWEKAKQYQEGGDFYGSSVSLSPSGKTLAVGSSADNGPNDEGMAGTFWVYILDGLGWSDGQQISPSAPSNSFSGTSIAATDVRIVSGSPVTSVIYPYSFDGTTWVAQSAINGDSGSAFGTSIAMDDTFLLVGAPKYSFNSGGVFLFTIDSSGAWALSLTLTSSTSSAMGMSLAISTSLLASGATDDDSSDGAVYLWGRSSQTVDDQPQKLAGNPNSAANFGQSVAILTDKLVAGGTLAGNVIYIFTFASTWSLSRNIDAPSGLSSFGKVISFHNNFLFVGADNGAVIYTLSGNSGSPTYTDVTLDTFDGNVDTVNGVAINGDYAVASYTSSVNCVVISKRKPKVDPKVTTFTVSKTSKSEMMGHQVAILEDIAIVSVPFCFNTADCDGGYFLLYKKDTASGSWKYLKTVRNPYRNRDNKFGSTIALNEYYLIVSAPDSTYISTDIGIAVFYQWDSTKQIFVKVSSARYRKVDSNYDFGASISNIDTVTVFGMPEYNIDSTLTQVGCVHIMRKKENQKWGKRVTITASTISKGERLGQSVSMLSQTRFAASNNPDASSSAPQVVYLYDYASDVWEKTQTIPSEGAPGFGWKIAFFNSLLYISSPGGASSTNTGSIKVHTVDGSGQYVPLYTIEAAVSVPGNRFGYSFATDGSRLVVGAKPCETAPACNIPGVAYTFTLDNGGKWAEQGKFVSPVADGSDGFGHDVAIKGDTVLVSAPTSSTETPRRGAVRFIQP